MSIHQCFIYLALLSISFFSINACTNVLELSPQQDISQSIALNSDKNVKTVLIGAYYLLGNEHLFGGNIQRDAELLGGLGEVRWVGIFKAPREIFNNAMEPSNEEVLQRWMKAYEGINTVNNVLSAIPIVKPKDRDMVEGEALFIRALLYFELIRYYAAQYNPGLTNQHMGVPLLLSPTRGLSITQGPERASVEMVYQQILSDGLEAEAKLPFSNGFFANKAAARSLLARVFLQMGDFSNALNYANSVIESGDYSLLPQYGDIFNRTSKSPEDIFCLHISEPNEGNSLNTYFSIPSFGGRDGDIEILSGHLSLYAASDERLGLFFEGNGATRTGKWNNPYGTISLFRLAEMYLIRMECNLRLSSNLGSDPLTDYNELNTRAGLPPKTSIILEDILQERRRELAHEGFRIHDLRRLGRVAGLIEANDPKLVFPIPARELELNRNLNQNEGY